ncbi:hypothetical protein ANN_09384 [Periplaneta americana]|uniref:Uncharacterized protein n=1 Tax=Periplaneta americana TaxID=6978 RepID=A0ABQ8TNE4_PERAM|nr:hypothetical protein ANN_09384 [Periplaneta americana]
MIGRSRACSFRKGSSDYNGADDITTSNIGCFIVIYTVATFKRRRPSPAEFRSAPFSRTWDSYNLTWVVESYPPLEEVRLLYRKLMSVGIWMQRYGKSALFTLAVRDFLNFAYPGRWIARGGLIECSARIPDLMPLDYFFRGHIKNLIYETQVIGP